MRGGCPSTLNPSPSKSVNNVQQNRMSVETNVRAVCSGLILRCKHEILNWTSVEFEGVSMRPWMICYFLCLWRSRNTGEFYSDYCRVALNLTSKLMQAKSAKVLRNNFALSNHWEINNEWYEKITHDAINGRGQKRERTKHGALLHGVPYGLPKWSTLKILFQMHTVDPCVSSISNSA